MYRASCLTRGATVANEALESAARAFANLILAKVKVFRDIVHRRENPEVIGDIIEELIREYINSWLAPMGIYNGSLWCSQSQKMMQIDGLVWQPSFGPPLLRQGNFLLLHPNTARAAVEIKTSENNLKALRDRLSEIWSEYFEPVGYPRRDCLGVVLHHPDPDGASRPTWNVVEGHPIELHMKALHAHPIYILFKRVSEFEYEPFMPAVEAMLFYFNYVANDRRLNRLL